MRISGFCLFVLALLACSAARAGTINGAVTLLEDGQPAVGAHVALYQHTSPFSQVLVDEDVIGASGEYVLTGSDGGQFQLGVTLAGRVTEGRTFPGSASPLTYNFALSLPSTITITVRDAVTLQPIQGATVNFYSNGSSAGAAATDASGIAIHSGIRGGGYLACVIDSRDAYRNECHDNQYLPLGNAIQGMTPFPLNGGQNLALTLDLDAVGASVSGTLTNRYLGTPIAQSISFNMFDVNGVQLEQAQLNTNAQGIYTLRGLARGTFFLQASGTGNNYYSPRVFPDIDCASGCTVTQGTAITVAGDESVTGIDFSLHPGSVVTGRVTEAGTGTGLANVPVIAGNEFFLFGWGQVAQTTTAIDGSYTLAHIPPGPTNQQYRLGTRGVSTHINQSWPNIPCFGANCFDGSSLSIARDEVRNGIDFQLTAGASFSGTVLEQTSAQSLDATIVFRNESGTISNVISHTSSSPTYSSPGLPPGTYFAYAYRQSGAIQKCQVFFGLPCASPNPINPATATPIVISGTGVVSGIDFTFDDAELFMDGFEL